MDGGLFWLVPCTIESQWPWMVSGWATEFDMKYKVSHQFAVHAQVTLWCDPAT